MEDQTQRAYIHIRLPQWMRNRFMKVTKRGEVSHLIRKKIMEIVKEREEKEGRS